MTTTVSFPYGKTERTCTLETSELKAVITGSLKDYQAPLSQAELVSPCPGESHRHAAPFGDGCRQKEYHNHHQRSHPPHAQPHYNAASPVRNTEGKSAADISILVATGTHRAASKDELLERFGQEIISREKYSFMTAMTGSPWQSWAPLPAEMPLPLTNWLTRPIC